MPRTNRQTHARTRTHVLMYEGQTDGWMRAHSMHARTHARTHMRGCTYTRTDAQIHACTGACTHTCSTHVCERHMRACVCVHVLTLARLLDARMSYTHSGARHVERERPDRRQSSKRRGTNSQVQVVQGAVGLEKAIVGIVGTDEQARRTLMPFTHSHTHVRACMCTRTRALVLRVSGGKGFVIMAGRCASSPRHHSANFGSPLSMQTCNTRMRWGRTTSRERPFEGAPPLLESHELDEPTLSEFPISVLAPQKSDRRKACHTTSCLTPRQPASCLTPSQRLPNLGPSTYTHACTVRMHAPTPCTC